MMQQKIGIMGGTFDPIHIGHLILAEETRNCLNLEKVIFVPTGRPPHKESLKMTSSKNRYEMTVLATADNPYFFTSSMEIDREGTTYTIDTVKTLNKKYRNIQLFFITGADSLINIHKWKNYNELLQICKFVVSKRIGVSDEKLQKRIEKINETYGKTVYEVQVPYIDISSTEIRNKVKNGVGIKYYVPESVEKYIKKNKLYIE